MGEFEKILREKDREFQMELEPGSWERLQQKRKGGRRKKFVLLWAVAASFVVFAGFASIFYRSAGAGEGEDGAVESKVISAELNLKSDPQQDNTKGKVNGAVASDERLKDNNNISTRSARKEKQTSPRLMKVQNNLSAGQDHSARITPDPIEFKLNRDYELPAITMNVKAPVYERQWPDEISVLASPDTIAPYTISLFGSNKFCGTTSRKGFWTLGIWYEYGMGYRVLTESPTGMNSSSFQGTGSSNGGGYMVYDSEIAPERTGNDKKQSTWAYGLQAGYQLNRWHFTTGLSFRQMGYTTHVREFVFPDPTLQRNKNFESYTNNYSVPEVKSTESEFHNEVRFTEIPVQVGFNVINKNRFSVGILAGASFKMVKNFNYVVWDPSEFVYYQFKHNGNGLNSHTFGYTFGAEFVFKPARGHHIFLQPVMNRDFTSVVSDPRYGENLYNYALRTGYRFNF